jgi:uncharacterized sulfatase
MIWSYISDSIQHYYSLFIVFALLFLAARIFEQVCEYKLHGSEFLAKEIFMGFLNDVSFLSCAAICLYVIYLPLFIVSMAAAKVCFIILATLLLIIQLLLAQYFLIAMVPLGSDLWGYSLNDLRQIINISRPINFPVIVASVIISIAIVCAFTFLPAKINGSDKAVIITLIIFLAVFLIKFFFSSNQLFITSEYSNNVSLNKSDFLYRSLVKDFFHGGKRGAYVKKPIEGQNDLVPQDLRKYIDIKRYPFLYTADKTANVLSPFFIRSDTPPNIIILIIEGLGQAFSNKDAYLGSFTPFIDSLSEKSLYWKNFLSTSGRTFAVLPSLTGSLPFAIKGFNDLDGKMPPHFSLLNLLKCNGYTTSFYYGGDSRFDLMDVYLKKNGVTNIYDAKTFPKDYIKMPGKGSNISWGYCDKELFRRYLETKTNLPQPYCDILLTVSTHIPFFINEQEKYLQKFESRMDELHFDERKKRNYRHYKFQYASILYMDDAVRDFITENSKRADFNNSILIITGDHCMTELPLKSKIDPYRVPFIIYSPLIKAPATFSSISSHFDVTPSILEWLKDDYQLRIPEVAHWIGTGLDMAKQFRNIHALPLKQVKNQTDSFIMSNYMINENRLFTIRPDMDITIVKNRPDIYALLKSEFNDYKQRNNLLVQGGLLIPDDILDKYLCK